MADPDGTDRQSLVGPRPAADPRPATDPRLLHGSFAASKPRPPGGPEAPSGPHIGPMRLTPFRLVLGLAFVGSAIFIAYAIVVVRDASQIPMLSAGFLVLGVATAAIAVAAVIEVWRAAAGGRNGRALGLAILGGVVGLGAIGCFTLTVLLALLWRSA